MLKLEKFLDLCEKNKKLDPYYKELNSKEFFKQLTLEIAEVLEELEKENNSELEKELGDVLWNFFSLFYKLEDEGKISKQKVVDLIIDKMSRRKSFLIDGKKVGKKEAMKIWNEAKTAEGYDKSRLWKGI